ncbi:hypothetical protein PHYC_02180 [Phycisphaerales bacterium]|nr:hypothetical protein PHYC_02180 [Phycisphaerales bacterium]
MCAFGSAHADNVIHQVGDVDGYVPGGVADLLPRSPEVEGFLQNHGFWPPTNADDRSTNDGPRLNWVVGWTHDFAIPQGQTIVGATLRVGVYPAFGAVISSDFLALDLNVVPQPSPPWGTPYGPRAVLVDIANPDPQPGTTTEIVIDLAAVPMRPAESGDPVMYDLLPQLQDGSLNILLADDSGLDYSILEVTTVPAPGITALAFAIILTKRRQRRI